MPNAATRMALKGGGRHLYAAQKLLLQSLLFTTPLGRLYFPPSALPSILPRRTFTTTHCHSHRSLPASYYRGGTSRAVFFHRSHLPSDSEEWPFIFRAVLGSPDPHGRQLNGMGGGVSSLSKVCIVGPTQGPDRNRAEVEYTMVAVGVKDDKVDFSGNCGNITAAVGPWAWEEGVISQMSDIREDGQRRRTVNMLNGNTGKVIRSTFEIANDKSVQTKGHLALPGVAGTGTPIRLDFLDPAGSKTGTLLPTGSSRDHLAGVPVTCIDAGNPCVFVPASALVSDATLLPEAMERDDQLCKRLEEIRQAAAVKMGLATGGRIPDAIPKICWVAPAEESLTLSGEMMGAAAVDILARALSMGQPHRAIPITVALCLAVATKVHGTVVQECLRGKEETVKGGVLTIGHPSGTMEVGADTKGTEVECATLYRTARRLMEGRVLWNEPDE